MRLILPLLFGLAGFVVLAALGLWQLQRMEWKQSVIAEIEARIGADPVPVAAVLDPETDNFRPVIVEGRISGPPIRVLGAWRSAGSGFKVIVPLQTAQRTLMVDLGIVPLETSTEALRARLPEGPIRVTGNLNWPDDLNAGTPSPEGDIWYARDVPTLAPVMGTDPVMVVARDVTPPAGPTPVPVGVEGIPNNHLGYAVQWFGLALVWLGMTLFLLWRIRRRTL
ncbi:SURF1 family protein [Jannaschia helgolandensis]|uniref:SURF1 family protein n=1 Tax=Jannaschia helgolandensis TaxID=188906 RepID=UPI0030D8D3F1|tara:strand:+ start:5048 stop:5719 length:672 start_codon:yes stop_codon:yes gene_type:complete